MYEKCSIKKVWLIDWYVDVKAWNSWSGHNMDLFLPVQSKLNVQLSLLYVTIKTVAVLKMVIMCCCFILFHCFYHTSYYMYCSFAIQCKQSPQMSLPPPTEHFTQGTFHASSKPANSPRELIKYSETTETDPVVTPPASYLEAQQQEKSDDPVGHM